MTVALERPVVPVVNPSDAAETYKQLRPYLLKHPFAPVIVYVVEKAGGAPDKAGVKQREEYADEIFSEFRNRARTGGIEVDTKLLY